MTRGQAIFASRVVAAVAIFVVVRHPAGKREQARPSTDHSMTENGTNTQVMFDRIDFRYGTWDKGENTPREDAVIVGYLKTNGTHTGEPPAATSLIPAP